MGVREAQTETALAQNALKKSSQEEISKNSSDEDNDSIKFGTGSFVNSLWSTNSAQRKKKPKEDGSKEDLRDEKDEATGQNLPPA